MVRGNIPAVNDEEDVLGLVRYNFHKEGIKVDTAATGEDALKKVSADLHSIQRIVELKTLQKPGPGQKSNMTWIDLGLRTVVIAQRRILICC